ncbi:unnamed protein product [Toxocara canis]|uniref:RDD domain-containing protein n=1 Tax=Toxocara canis TaxID=6265 RepID=A0A183V5D3_TOXCA|nr:unnamed protein product [Toxocara canis]
MTHAKEMLARSPQMPALIAYCIFDRLIQRLYDTTVITVILRQKLESRRNGSFGMFNGHVKSAKQLGSMIRF